MEDKTRQSSDIIFYSRPEGDVKIEVIYKQGMRFGKDYLIRGIICLIFNLFIITYCNAQFYDGFVITSDNHIVRGYMQISLGEGGRKISITSDKNKTAATYYGSDLRSYAYKKDTFEILNAFHPFEGEDYYAEAVEGKVIISKGRLKLYHGTFLDYKSMWVAPNPAVGYMANAESRFYVVKDREGNLYGIKNGRDEFIKTIEQAVGDDKELMERIRNRELKHKDIKKIINLYNSKKRSPY